MIVFHGCCIKHPRKHRITSIYMTMLQTMTLDVLAGWLKLSNVVLSEVCVPALKCKYDAMMCRVSMCDTVLASLLFC